MLAAAGGARRVRSRARLLPGGRVKPLRASLELLLALVFSVAVALAVTWPAILHLDDVVIGSGELGGWLWRQWWHFEEVKALRAAEDLGPWEHFRLLVSLGRHPETGNIMDVLLLSYPLDHWLGFPEHHTVKVLLIVIGNGLCGYALARSLSSSPLVALTAASVAMINPLVFQDINKTGLRQVLLWWLLLYPIALQRAARTSKVVDGVLVGAAFTAVAAFYWFYGMFAAVFSAIWLLGWALRSRPDPRRALRWMAPAAVTAGAGVAVFLMPYFAAVEGGGMEGGGFGNLPEVTLFLPFPDYDVIASAPEFPNTIADNLLASLHRNINSAWPADYVVNPFHGARAMPLIVLFMGVLMVPLHRTGFRWLATWLFFYLGTLGPFLKLGAMKDTAEVVRLGEYVVRLPYTLMYQFIPGMSRMFGPYRLAGMMVVASVALVAIALDRARPSWRRVLAPLALVFTLFQCFYQFDIETAELARGRFLRWRVPVDVVPYVAPPWYRDLALEEGSGGIVELPLFEQQDLMAFYQTLHRRKVYRSWATISAVPPIFREGGGGRSGELMRRLASTDPRIPGLEQALERVSRPTEGRPPSFDTVQEDDIARLIRAGYQLLIVHERGYWVQDPRNGPLRFQAAVRAIEERLRIAPELLVEVQAPVRAGRDVMPAWLPLASREVTLPLKEMPSQYYMAVFDLIRGQPSDGTSAFGPALPEEGEGEEVPPPPEGVGPPTGDGAPPPPEGEGAPAGGGVPPPPADQVDAVPPPPEGEGPR